MDCTTQFLLITHSPQKGKFLGSNEAASYFFLGTYPFVI